jgi:hypothetical protein
MFRCATLIGRVKSTGLVSAYCLARHARACGRLVERVCQRLNLANVALGGNAANLAINALLSAPPPQTLILFVPGG